MLLVLFALTGCVPATVYGLRFDGTMAENSELAAVAAYYPEFAAEQENVGDASLVGLQGRQRLGNDITASLVVGTAPGTFADSPYANAELDVQGRILNEKPLTIMLSGGLSAVATPDAAQLNLLAGFQVGAVVSRHVGADLRPFLGAKLNPVFGGDNQLYPWITAGGGLTWRPVVAPGTRMLLGAEAYVLHGVGVDLMEHTDATTWGAGLQLGASFGNEHRP